MRFTKKDLLFSVITGLITGFSAWQIFDFLNVPEFYGLSFSWFLVFMPIFWILGVNLGYFLGKWVEFFNQFGKFVAIGFTNAAVDFGVLNLLIAWTDFATGNIYSLFKAISFTVAVLHSYVWNKHWSFEAGQSQGGSKEFGKFIIVTLIALAVNVGIASFVVNRVSPILNLDTKSWANIGAVVGAAGGLIFSFTGFRVLVFKKRNNVTSPL